MEERTIIELLNARDEQAIAAMRKKYGPLCSSVARGILSSTEDAEETVNDAFFAVWNRVPPENPRSLTAYVCQIVRNLAYNRVDYNTAAMRDSRMTIALNELEGFLKQGGDPADLLDSRIIGDTINRYLDGLKQEDRVLFVRRYYYFDTCSDIARACGRSAHGVATRLYRMRKELQKMLIQEGIEV